MRGEHDANVNTEVLQELIFFFWRRRRIEEGFGVFDRLLRGFPDPFAVTVREVTTARELQSHHPTIAPRDALHAAVVLEHGLEGIISADRRFDAIPGITRFDPMEF
jgi:predicted nucleic acid-binding protein